MGFGISAYNDMSGCLLSSPGLLKGGSALPNTEGLVRIISNYPWKLESRIPVARPSIGMNPGILRGPDGLPKYQRWVKAKRLRRLERSRPNTVRPLATSMSPQKREKIFDLSFHKKIPNLFGISLRIPRAEFIFAPLQTFEKDVILVCVHARNIVLIQK